MAITDPKPPLRRDLEEMCGGNKRLVKAFEQLFRLVPSEFNNSNESSLDTQFTADFAQASANLANSSIADVERIVDLIATSPAPIINTFDPIGVAPRYEVVISDPIYPVYQGEDCPNYNLEVM